MSKDKKTDSLTRQQMQNEAMIVEGLLDATLALQAGGADEEAIGLVEMALSHAARLNRALDFVNAPKGMD